ncbi:MAG: methylaspartate mutase subunit E [Chloroflexota bacterium]|jgi:methylaspartate mutase epsilon subunit
MKSTISFRRLTDEEFEAERQRALSLWPTGSQIDLDEAVEYHRQIPSHKNYAKTIRDSYESGKTLVQPRGGVPILEWHIKLLRCLQDEGGADLLPTTTDSYTRNEQFANAQRGIDESEKAGHAMLNGLPVVCHGKDACRKVIEAVDRPIILLSGSSMTRLTAETVLAAGYSAFLGSGIAYTISYTKTMPIEQGIRNYQYVDRLVSYYTERGIKIHREQPGFLTGTLVPHGLGIAIAALDSLLAAEQGIKHYGVGLAQSLCLSYDIAGLKVLTKVCRHYLERYNHSDVFICPITHQWMGAFPTDEARAYGVICQGGVIAALSGAAAIVTKSVHEAFGVPTAEANAAGVRVTKEMIRLLKGVRYPDSPEIQLEMSMLEDEAVAIVDKVLELGDGDPALGAVRAFEAGVLDVPWSPSQYNAHKVMPALDSNGAIRYLAAGNLPLPPHVAEYHREKLAERGRREGREVGPDMAIDDVMAVADGC